jgi:DNA-binding Xre family transcriptional regulator
LIYHLKNFAFFLYERLYFLSERHVALAEVTMKKEIGKRVGHRIKIRRAELEMSQGDLASALGLSQGQVSHLEKGTRPMDLETLEAIAKALKCKPEQLLKEPLESEA